jgi:hypothetical protein
MLNDYSARAVQAVTGPLKLVCVQTQAVVILVAKLSLLTSLLLAFLLSSVYSGCHSTPISWPWNQFNFHDKCLKRKRSRI